ncbi:MAG: hypothetical protein FGM24_07755 [Candidatus Kapabacteria bacterium]|nr:hypothetical protein [Candidatus Kapabacteria bacterium]
MACPMKSHLLLAVLIAAVMTATGNTAGNRIVVRFTAGSPTSARWFEQDRHGELPSFTPILGRHTTAPYLLDATLQCYQGALDRRMALLRSTQDGAPRWRTLPLARTAVISCDRDARTMAAKLRTHPDVEAVDVMPRHELFEIPNDTLYPAQWHLGIIQAAKAWEALPADATAVVGVIDTGMQFDHPDLATQAAENVGETGVDAEGADKRSNGKDDDNNGFVDDWRGWDFVSTPSPQTGDNDPSPGASHGTHVAGIIAAATNNLIGIAGTAVKVKVLPVKVGPDDPSSRGVERTADGIMYAASMGVDVINCSFGSASQSFADEDVVNAATDLGVLVVGAAGNAGVDGASFPAAYERAVSVAASGTSDRLALFTNRHRTVDITAPGQSILSTVPTDSYERYDGTSMASPVVAGVAAMVTMMRPTASPAEIRAVLMTTAWNIDSLNPFAAGRFGSGRVDAFAAVSSSDVAWATVTASTFADANGDGLFAPGERARISLKIRNELRALRDATIRVSNVPAAFAATIEQEGGSLGTVGTGESRDVNDMIVVTLPDTLPYNASLDLLVEILDEGRPVGRSLISTNVNTTYRTLDRNDLAITVNSRGNFGYNDYPDNAQGDGATYRGSNHLLFEGALMIGTAAGNLVNVARGADTDQQDTGFSISGVLTIKNDSVPSGIRAVTSYTDALDPYRIGVDVRQHAYQASDDSVRNVLLTCYDIRNTADTALTNVHAALFFDWDIGPNGQQNIAAWDAANGIGRMRNIARNDYPQVGVAMISPYTTHFFAVDNDGVTSLNPGIYDNFLRGEKWLMMSNGIARASSATTDASMVIGGGPFTLAAGETRQICFAIAAGDEGMITQGIASGRLRARSMGLNAGDFVAGPTASRIVHIEDGPTLQPGSTTVSFTVHFISGVIIDLVDLFGRTVSELYSSYDEVPGMHVATVNIPNVAAGNYFMRLRTATTTDVAPIAIVR